MAWAERLPSGRYRGVYRDAFGKKTPLKGTFTHKAKAERAAAHKEEEARKSMLRDPEAYRRPWGDWAIEWWEHRTIEESTKRSDLIRRNKHLDPKWANVPIGSIRRGDVKDWAADLRRGGMGPETVKRCVHLLSASLTAAVDKEIIQSNPAARLKLPGGEVAVERFLTRSEYSKLREQLPTTGDQLVFDMLIHTGLRWGELSGLHWDRVDLARGLLRVVETYDEDASVMKAYPKGKRIRDVPLTAELVTELSKLEPHGTTCGAKHALGKCRGPLVFTTERGMPMRNTNWAHRVWSKSVEAAGIGDVRIHDCRHTYASWLLQAGVPLAEVGKLLGHISAQTTQRYAHLAETPSAAVLAALAAPSLPHVEQEKRGVHAQGR